MWFDRADSSSPANINMVSGGYFPTLGVDPMLGHTFGIEVDKGRNAHPIALSVTDIGIANCNAILP